jgi:cytochrome d ubiquinol oxidase subunit I
LLGLDAFRPEHRPPVLIPFASFHVMVSLGMFFITITLVASYLRWRGKLYTNRWLMWIFVFAVLGAVAANQLGWVAAEVGRQPWIVHPPMSLDAAGEPLRDSDGYVRYQTTKFAMLDGSIRESIAGLRTSDATSEVVTSGQVLGSIVLFGMIYVFLGTLWVFVLNKKIQHGPDPPLPHRSGGSLPGARGSLVDGSGQISATRGA